MASWQQQQHHAMVSSGLFELTSWSSLPASARAHMGGSSEAVTQPSRLMTWLPQNDCHRDECAGDIATIAAAHELKTSAIKGLTTCNMFDGKKTCTWHNSVRQRQWCTCSHWRLGEGHGHPTYSNLWIRCTFLSSWCRQDDSDVGMW